ncbi:reverse transcriptase domain-containing protein [Tanacetum coccineum]
MVKEGIVLGHKVSKAGLEVDKAKIDVISKLPPPTNIKEKLTCAPVIISLNWNLPFELMCDASDFAVGTIVHTDHSALRHLFKKQDAKPCLIHWKLKTKKVQNVTADHLSQIENDETSDDSEVDDNFPRETLMEINTRDEPWFADFENYLYDQTLMPKALISDRGIHFCNKIMEKTMKRYGVNHRFSTSYHPQTSGEVENTNRALKRILEKTVKDNPAIWSRKLDEALWAFRTAYKTPTGTTPYKLVYGKNCHLPFETKHRATSCILGPEKLYSRSHRCW